MLDGVVKTGTAYSLMLDSANWGWSVINLFNFKLPDAGCWSLSLSKGWMLDAVSASQPWAKLVSFRSPGGYLSSLLNRG